MSDAIEPVRAAKVALRARQLAARRALPAAQRVRHGRQLAAAALADERLAGAGLVTAYISVGTEPPTGPLLDGLRAAGVVVLLPVVLSGGRLAWSAYPGFDGLSGGPYGLLEPTGKRLPAAEAGAADLLLVPALAVDRVGHRLGRGGGYYDRLLGALAGGPPALAVVYDSEVLQAVPVEPHDVPVAGALTAAGVTMWA